MMMVVMVVVVTVVVTGPWDWQSPHTCQHIHDNRLV